MAVGGARKKGNFPWIRLNFNIGFRGLFLLSPMNLPPTPDIDFRPASTNEQIGFYTVEQVDAFQ